MGLDMLLFFSLPIQYIHVETRHSRLPQASEQCFRKTPNYLKNSLLQEEGMFGVLRKHCSEACGRRLYLVLIFSSKSTGDINMKIGIDSHTCTRSS